MEQKRRTAGPLYILLLMALWPPLSTLSGCGSTDPTVRLEEARRLRSEGQPQQAAEILHDLLGDLPRDFTLNYELAGALHDSGSNTAALDAIAMAIEADPVSLDARALRASILSGLGRDEEALRISRRIVKADPGRAGTHKLMAAIHARAGRYDRAVNQFEKELVINPADGAVLTELGIFYLRSGSLDEASDRLEQAVKSAPGSGRAHRYLADVRFKQLRTQEGLELQAKALELSPSNTDLFADHLRALYNYGRAADSRRLLEEALSSGEPDPRVLLEAARQAVDRLDFEGAVRALQRAASIDPQRPKPHSELGRIYLRLARNEEALEAFNEANRLSPTDPYPLYYLGTLAADRGDTDEAIRLYRRSLELDPYNPKAHYALGRALLRIGRRAEAEAELAKHSEILRVLREKQQAGVATMD
jgi:tetratricopeptide (TPR) repeat protein